MFPSSKLQWKAWSWEDERRKFCFCGGRAGLSGQQGCWVSYTNRLFLLPCFPIRGHAVPPPCFLPSVLRSRHSNRVTTQSSSPTSPAFSLCAWFPPTRRFPRGTTSMDHTSANPPFFFYIIFCITWFPFPCRVMWHGNTQNSLNSKS